MRSSRSELMASLIDDVAHLTKPYDHSEPMDNGKTHVSSHQSLLRQLWNEVHESTPSSNADGSSKRSQAGSRTPINDELMELLITADKLSTTLVMMSGGKLQTSIAENFYQLPSVLVNATDELIDHVSGQIAYYRNQLELALNWKEKPRKISRACPLCSMSNAITVQMDHYGPTSARCTKCHAEWDKTQLGILAGSMKKHPE
jgi:hypothetical protein